jgi:hypothetical protein
MGQLGFICLFPFIPGVRHFFRSHRIVQNGELRFMTLVYRVLETCLNSKGIC